MNQPAEPTRLLYLLTDEISSVLVRGQLGYMAEHGFEVTVATRLGNPQQPTTPGGKWDVGVRVEHVPFVREPSPIADLLALSATVQLIRRVRPNIVNASTPKAGLLGMLAAWLCRVPERVYVVRGLRFETASGFRRRLFRALEWVAIRCANHVLFNSVSLLEVAEGEGLIRAGHGEVVGAGSGNGIDLERFADDALPTRVAARSELGLPLDVAVVGFVGRFTNDKGIADLVEAFDSISRRDSCVWLLLVGQFEPGDRLPADVRLAVEGTDRILNVAWLDNPGIAYRAMDLLAFPSYREGLPNVPLEAQLCGVPVVAYRASGTVDAIEDGVGGVLVDVGDANALAESLDALLKDGERRTSMGAAGAAWVTERFSCQVLWSALEDRFRLWVKDSPASK